MNSQMIGLTAALFVLPCTPLCAQVTQRVSVDSSGLEGNGNSGLGVRSAISDDGRFVAYSSAANDLVVPDTNGSFDVFVRDRFTGITARISVASNGAQGNGDSGQYDPISISADGRYVAFESYATNLVGGDTNNATDVFVRDRLNGITERVSVSSSGAQGSEISRWPSISADGRWVAFLSYSGNLVSGDTNGIGDVFVRDRQTGITERVSVATGGAQASGSSNAPSVSADGRYVAFDSFAANLVAGDTNGWVDVFVRDRLQGITERVSVDSGGVQGDSRSTAPSISGDGRFVAFDSFATNLVGGDTNDASDVFVRDRQTATTTRVSVGSSGAQADRRSSLAAISADGQTVAFVSLASNLAAGDTNTSVDVFVRDLQSGNTERMSVASSGAQADAGSDVPSVSGDGRIVAFASLATNLIGADANGFADVFVHDRFATSFTSLCDPGAAGVIACPCSNAPVGPGRGCDNSAATGGASLAASGATYLSEDALVFTTSGQVPGVTSIVLQGNALAAGGIAFGQGVRCADGSLLRLYVKTAVAGGITAPDFGAGDPSVSARALQLGDAIAPGETRWYLVYYRDPIVLGGCPSSSTFNATQTGEVCWSP